jgi:hypothetical protein
MAELVMSFDVLAMSTTARALDDLTPGAAGERREGDQDEEATNEV